MKSRTLLLILLLLVCPLVFSQVPPAPQQPPPGDVPVDGGVIALVLAGLFYGIKKSLKKNN
ncbi:MAG: PID-CTERM protein-sorting domain-containing protein [Flavobacteriaceae bacterium]